MKGLLLDHLLPRRSLNGTSGTFITPEERWRLGSYPVIEYEKALRKQKIRYLDSLRAGSLYSEAPLLKEAIRQFKYGRVRALAKDLASIMVRVTPPLVEADIVVCPVPVHWTRRLTRGFNQAELLCDHLAAKRGCRVQKLLKRRTATGHQAWRKRKERMAALQNAFVCTGNDLPRHIILVDDICTTGATLDACAKILKQAGVERVDGWVIARG